LLFAIYVKLDAPSDKPLTTLEIELEVVYNTILSSKRLYFWLYFKKKLSINAEFNKY
jgi:hypothetical protein